MSAFACRAGVREALMAVWDSALRGKSATAEMRTNARLAAVTAVQKCAEIVPAAYDASGASAVRRADVLQRLLRDASSLQHHLSRTMRDR